MLKNTKKLNVGDYHFATSGGLVALLWHDHKDVYMLTTAHSRSVDTMLKRLKGGHEKEPVTCPTAVIDYNNFMGGVDLMDHYLSYYSLSRRRTIS